jgi:hypothetical protein
MQQPNTLFLIAKFGLKGTDKVGVLESHMWLLDPADITMENVSFHKSKSDRAYKGGKILGFRDATDEEFQAHQELMQNPAEGSMADNKKPRQIIVFQPIRLWNKLWPASAKSKPMAFKALGYVPPGDT